MTVAMALAERTHHSSRGQTIARARVWGHEMNYTATIRDPPTPQPELFSLFDEEPGGVRPGSVTDPASQARVERHVVEHSIEACPFVQILDAPVPQGGNQLAPRFAHPRADHRSAQDLVFSPSLSQAPGSCGADGGTDGGCAGIRVVCFSVPAADR